MARRLAAEIRNRHVGMTVGYDSRASMAISAITPGGRTL